MKYVCATSVPPRTTHDVIYKLKVLHDQIAAYGNVPTDAPTWLREAIAELERLARAKPQLATVPLSNEVEPTAGKFPAVRGAARLFRR